MLFSLLCPSFLEPPLSPSLRIAEASLSSNDACDIDCNGTSSVKLGDDEGDVGVDAGAGGADAGSTGADTGTAVAGI